jgi:hypothetical protein
VIWENKLHYNIPRIQCGYRICWNIFCCCPNCWQGLDSNVVCRNETRGRGFVHGSTELTKQNTAIDINRLSEPEKKRILSRGNQIEPKGERFQYSQNDDSARVFYIRLLLAWGLCNGYLFSPGCLFVMMSVRSHIEKEKCKIKQQTSCVGHSTHENYTDLATDTCQRNLVPTFADRGMSRGQRDGSPKTVNLSFLDRSRYFSFK